MTTLNVNGNEYKLPSSFTVEEWGRYCDLVGDDILLKGVGMSKEDFDLLNEDQVKLAVSFILGSINFKIKRLSKKLNGSELINLENLTFGQWIDMEVYIDNGYSRHFNDMLKLLYNTDKDFNDIDYHVAIPAIELYLKYRVHIYSSYRKLFGQEEDQDEDTTNHKHHRPAAKVWMDVVMSICNDDVLKMDEVIELPLVKTFNFLAYRKEQAYKAYLESQRR